MSENTMLQEAIDAVRKGQRARARDLLTRLLRADQNNPEYWLWMSSVVDTQKEQVYCLESVLRLEPDNRLAERGMMLLGAAPTDTLVTPVPPLRRKWSIDTLEEPRPTGFRALLANPILSAVMFGGILLLVVGLILAGIFGVNFQQKKAVASRPTHTSGPPPTFTVTPTFIGGGRRVAATPIPKFVGPTPLWMLLEATYTPTPAYVNTPHAISEAFRAGQRAFERGDLPSALKYMQQASQVEPQAVDIHYYIGEIYFSLEQIEEALQAHEQALNLNPNFSPAILGRARSLLALDSETDISEELDLAIGSDPNFAEAYLDRAAYFLKQGDFEAAQEDLDIAETLLPDSPLIYLLRGQADLMQGESESALQNAERAVKMDVTMLPAYLLVGEAALSGGDAQRAVEALETYTRFEEDDANVWLKLAQAYYESDAPGDDIVEAIDRSLTLDDRLANAYYLRGLIYLDLEEGQPAVNDFVAARRFDRTSFDISLGLARALMLVGRLNDARSQFTGSLDLAEDDSQLAQVYYWRAQVLEALGNPPAAERDWNALLELPEDAYPEEWAAEAIQHTQPDVKPTETIQPLLLEK